MKKCSSCGIGLPDDVSFCTSCGGAAVEVTEEVAVPAVDATAPVVDATVPVVAVAETEAQTKKKFPKWLILAIVAVVAVGALLTVLLTTHGFGLMDPLDKPINAAEKTLEADSATIKISVNGGGEKHAVTAKMVLNEDKKTVTLLLEQLEGEKVKETVLVVDGDVYTYENTEDEVGYATVQEDAFDVKEVLKSYDELLDDGEVDWSKVIKEANLDSMIDAKKIDDFVDTFEKECLNNKKWLKENLGYEKDGNTYVFEPDFDELSDSLIDLCKDSKAFKKEAKTAIESALKMAAKAAKEMDLRVTASVTVEKGYISKIRIQVKGKDIDTMECTVTISDVNKTEISSKDIKKHKEKVENWIEENSCEKCKEELSEYEFNGKKYCYDCYYTCAECGDGWADYERDGMRVCYDCRYVCDKCEKACGSTNTVGEEAWCSDCFVCDSCGDTWPNYMRDGKPVCYNCRYACDKCEKACSDVNTVGEEKWCDDCYICDSCGSAYPRYERDGKPVCYDCRYVCDKCEKACSGTHTVGEEEWCSDCYVCSECGSSWPRYMRDGKPVCYNCQYECEECGEPCSYTYTVDDKKVCANCWYYR